MEHLHQQYSEIIDIPLRELTTLMHVFMITQQEKQQKEKLLIQSQKLNVEQVDEDDLDTSMWFK